MTGYYYSYNDVLEAVGLMLATVPKNQVKAVHDNVRYELAETTWVDHSGR